MGLKGFQGRSMVPKGPMVKPTTHAKLQQGWWTGRLAEGSAPAPVRRRLGRWGLLPGALFRSPLLLVLLLLELPPLLLLSAENLLDNNAARQAALGRLLGTR